MKIAGIGTDATEIARVVGLYERHPETFLSRVFTPGEQAYCRSRGKGFGESLAARWAVKEAVMKALGTGWNDGVMWTDIETRSLPSGKPELIVTGGAKKIADKRGIVEWQVSITHTKTTAIAFVIASAKD